MINVEILKNIAKKAGAKVMEIYSDPSQDFEVEVKSDNSPLTIADKASSHIIETELKQHFLNIPIMNEETTQVPYEQRKEWTQFFCVDPIDGTKEFIKKNGEFTINIALIENKTPIIGVVYVPAQQKIYWAVKGEGSFVEDNGSVEALPLQSAPKETVVASRSHMDETTKALIEGKGYVNIIGVGSTLKFCLVAEGRAFGYIRNVPTMEWDTAAGELLCTEVGKTIVSLDSSRKWEYNKENLRNPGFIVE